MRNSHHKTQSHNKKPRRDARSCAIITLSVLLGSFIIPFGIFVGLLCKTVFAPNASPDFSVSMLLIGVLTCGLPCFFLSLYLLWVSKRRPEGGKGAEGRKGAKSASDQEPARDLDSLSEDDLSSEASSRSVSRDRGLTKPARAYQPGLFDDDIGVSKYDYGRR